MRAVQVHTLTGPSDVGVHEIDPPTAAQGEVLVDVHSVGVSFPDLLLSRGEYQFKPEPPFTLGVDFAGTVVDPGASAFEVGQPVAGVNTHGGAAEQLANPADFTFPLPDELSYNEGAALPMNYLTALYALERGDVAVGTSVLVHGAAGGVGTAAIQVGKGSGARVIAVTSTEEKAEFARAAGADDAVLFDGFRDRAKEVNGGRGFDIVIDPVGGAALTDSLRLLAEHGRLMVVGFASGQGIPEVKVNRLLLNNIEVRGVGWGAYAMSRPDVMGQQWARLTEMIESGHVRPPIGATYELDGFGQALQDMDDRRTMGKSIVRVR